MSDLGIKKELQTEYDKMMAEAEADIKAERVLTHEELKDIVATWKK